MKINSIRIGGFKNIRNTIVDFDDIVSLLSINSYGKSNFLSGIVYGVDYIHQSPNVRKNMMNFDAYKPFNNKILLNDFLFEINCTFTNDRTEQQIVYGYSFSWKSKNNMPRIKTEYLKVKDDDSQKYKTYISRDNDLSLYKSSLTASCNKEIKIDDDMLIINKLQAFDDLFFIDIIKLLNNINVYVDNHFNTNMQYDIQPLVRKNLSDYNLNDDTNVPRILFRIKKEHPNKFKLIVNTLKDIFPFIDDIECIEYNIDDRIEKINLDLNSDYIQANKLYFLLCSDKNVARKIQISDMSDGVRRVLLIFTTLVLADINKYSLVGIEEPENSLNPRILQRYLIALKNFSSSSRIIITSHSPYLVNYLQPKNVYLGLPNDDGIAHFSRIKDKLVDRLINDAKSMDMLVGDYLFDLMSGDKEELETLIKYVEE